MSLRVDDQSLIKTPTDDHLVTELARLDVGFAAYTAIQGDTPPLAPATLLVRLALVPLLLARPA